jgi:hypothetical protein
MNYTYPRVFLSPTRVRPTQQHCPLILPYGRERSPARTLMRFPHIKRRPGYANIPSMIQNFVGYLTYLRLMRQETYHAVIWRISKWCIAS